MFEVEGLGGLPEEKLFKSEDSVYSIFVELTEKCKRRVGRALLAKEDVLQFDLLISMTKDDE